MVFIREIHKVILSSPSLCVSFHPLSPSLSEVRKVRKSIIKSGYECWNSAFNAQGSRLIIVVVQLGAVKIYVRSSGGAQEKRKERVKNPMKLTIWHKKDGAHFWVSPSLEKGLMYFFAGLFFWESHPVLDQTQGSWCCVFLTLRISVLCSHKY